MYGNVFGIKRFEIHDGPGVRTTVFLKGCPLRCVWCHNPEGIEPLPSLAVYPQKCIKCGKCAVMCPAHTFDSYGIKCFDRQMCEQLIHMRKCTHCDEKCLGNGADGALKRFGTEVSVEDVFNDVMRDKDFFASSGGGVTISGGEPLMQHEFVCELLEKLKCAHVHTALDTCGMASHDAFTRAVKLADIVLFDIKAVDAETHRKCTGADNTQILENFVYLREMGKATEVRIPFVPDMNGSEIPKIAKLLQNAKNVTRIKLLPYHSFAKEKYDALDKPFCDLRVPDVDEVTAACAILKNAQIVINVG